MTITDGPLTRRTALKAGAAAGVGLLVPWALGCGDDAESTTTAGGAGASKSVGSTTLPAPSLNLLGNAPLHVAAGLGFFAAAGVKVELADVVGTDVIRAVQTQAAIGVAGTIPSAVAFSKGVKDIRIVAPMYSAAQNTFIAPKSSKVKTLADLAPGMSIGGALPSTPPNYFADALIRKAGLAPGKDVKIVNLGRAPDAWTAAKKGLVDLTWSNPPFDTQLIEAGEAVRIAKASELAPSWLDTALVTTSAKLDGQKAIVQAVVAAIAQAQGVLRDDPERAAAAWAKGAKIPPAVAAAALKDAPPAGWSSTLDRAAFDSSIKAARDLGLIKPDADVGPLISDQITPA